MHRQRPIDIASFRIIGINYKKSDAAVRGQFAISNEKYGQLLAAAPAFGIQECFILSTCNRTEMYGFADSADTMRSLLCAHTDGDAGTFEKLAYCKSGKNAIEHLFHVAAGLDSQILGDYEIVGQIKQAAKFSKENNFLGCYLERMVNGVLQSAKKVRTNTGMSTGTVSVSFAAIQYIRDRFTDLRGKKILLLGTGKIGRNTCKNITDYLPKAEVVLVNRTFEKAKQLAEQYHLQWDHIENVTRRINEADIILVATSSGVPVILKEHFSGNRERLVIDLSVPCNVEESVKELPGLTLVNVDELSRLKDETLQKRMGEIPKVKLIIEEHVNEFLEWHDMRRYVPLLKNVKDKLLHMQTAHVPDPAFASLFAGGDKAAEDKVQKVINGMAVKMRSHNQPGCHYIEAINDFISITPAQ